MRELEERDRLMVRLGAFLRPICNIYKFFALPCTINTVTIHNSGLSVYYNNLIFIMDFGDDQNAFSRWLTFFTFAAAVALALPAKANTAAAASGQSSGW